MQVRPSPLPSRDGIPDAVEGSNPIDSIVTSCQLSPVGHPPVEVPVAVAGRSAAAASAAAKMKRRRRCTIGAHPLARKIDPGVAIILPHLALVNATGRRAPRGRAG